MGGESPIGYIAIYSPPYREGLGEGLFLWLQRHRHQPYNDIIGECTERK